MKLGRGKGYKHCYMVRHTSPMTQSLTLGSNRRFGSMLQLSSPCTCNESNYSYSIKACHITPSTPKSNLDHQWHLKDSFVLKYSSCKTSSVCRCVEEKRVILKGGANEPGKKKSRHYFKSACMCAHVPVVMSPGLKEYAALLSQFD